MKNWIRKYKGAVIFLVVFLSIMIIAISIILILKFQAINRIDKMVGAHFEIVRDGKIERVRVLRIIKYLKYEGPESAGEYVKYFVVEFSDGVVVLSRQEFNDFYGQGEKIKKRISETEKRRKILEDYQKSQN